MLKRYEDLVRVKAEIEALLERNGMRLHQDQCGDLSLDSTNGEVAWIDWNDDKSAVACARAHLAERVERMEGRKEAAEAGRQILDRVGGEWTPIRLEDIEADLAEAREALAAFDREHGTGN